MPISTPSTSPAGIVAVNAIDEAAGRNQSGAPLRLVHCLGIRAGYGVAVNGSAAAREPDDVWARNQNPCGCRGL